MNNFSQLNSKKFYLAVGVILVLLIAAVILTQALDLQQATDFSEERNNTNNTSGQQATLPAVSISEQAEVIEFGNTEMKIFDKVVLDPFLVNSDASQQVVVVPDSEVRIMKVELQDGNGTQEEIMRLGEFKDQQAYYLTWEPQQLQSNQKYPITFNSVTQEGSEHSLTLSWQAQ